MRLFLRLYRFFKEVRWVSFFRALRFTKNPIFIVGCERSGTTLLLSILGAHPNVFAIPHETNAYYYYLQKRSSILNMLIRRKKILGHLLKQRIPKSSKRFCEKTPRHVLYIGEILRDYNNNVNIIHIIRDGRDVISSVHPDYPERKNFVTIESWKQRTGNGYKYTNHPKVLTVKYENLISCYKETMQLIMQFIDEPYHKNIDEFFLHTNVKTHSAWKNGVKPLYNHSVRKHENLDKSPDVRAFESDKDSMDLLEMLGYE